MARKDKKSRSSQGSLNAKPEGKTAVSASKKHSGGDPIDALLQLIIEQGWRQTTLTDVAVRSGLTLAQLYARYRSKAELLDALSARIDAAVLNDGPVEEDASARDRLFEAIMRRFEALKPYREALGILAKDTIFEPSLFARFMTRSLRRGLDVVLIVAGLDDPGWRGQLRRQGLGVIYLDVFRIFLSDDSEDLSRTMATLNRRLQRAEKLVVGLRRFRLFSPDPVEG